ncbi:cytochrome P450 [Galbibacter sp. EGI 63066]|uniref:cytochrome P450 n=1 Tax=Galbibacter sp. EGI 63066 TaxID=2993559 RepID=UPI002248F501|nr:cytochrome P450 [Galbibacter sp. EGI 63066]MCX2679837.1 cytochrome P450 [Galbibacter sp. EGI 63066]
MKNDFHSQRISYLKFILSSSKMVRDPIGFYQQMFSKFGNNFSVSPPFDSPIVFTKDSAIAKHVLIKSYNYYEKSKLQTLFLSKYIGNGLLTSTGSYWLKQRRLIQPMFYKGQLDELTSNLHRIIQDEISKIPTDSYVDLYEIMNNLAFQVIIKTIFSHTGNTYELKRLQKMIPLLQRFISKNLRQPHKRPWFYINGEYSNAMKLAYESRNIIREIINHRRSKGKRYFDLLDMLIHCKYEDGTYMDNEQLIDETMILFLAGHETTASALSFTLFLLANNKDELNRAQKYSFCVKENVNIKDQIDNLFYVQNCIEESMRLYPPGWFTDRKALHDDVIEGVHIKKGTYFGISIFEIHRNNQYWDEPEKFDPNRFSKLQRKKNLNHYMPFGAGPRLCIGNNFAMYEMILAINAIINIFDVKTSKSTLTLEPLISLRPGPIKMIFTKRDPK